MNAASAVALLSTLMLLCVPCRAQPVVQAIPVVPVAPAPAKAPSTTPAPVKAAGTAEPKVQRTVIEDDGARIEELRVRGQATRIVVAPKRGGAAPYEIITGDGSRDPGDGTSTSGGTTGKRVWNVLKF